MASCVEMSSSCGCRSQSTEHGRRPAQSTPTASATRHSTRMNNTAEPLLRQDEKSEQTSMSKDTPQCDLYKKHQMRQLTGTLERRSVLLKPDYHVAHTSPSRNTKSLVAEHNTRRHKQRAQPKPQLTRWQPPVLQALQLRQRRLLRRSMLS